MYIKTATLHVFFRYCWIYRHVVRVLACAMSLHELGKVRMVKCRYGCPVVHT